MSCPVSLLGQLPNLATNSVTSELFDVVQSGDYTWVAAADTSGSVHVLAHSVTSNELCMSACINMAAPVALVQLGIPSSLKNSTAPVAAVLVIVTDDCRVWACALGIQGIGVVFESSEESSVVIPVAISGLARCSLAALVTWEYLVSSWNADRFVVPPHAAVSFLPLSNLPNTWTGQPIAQSIATLVTGATIISDIVSAAGCIIIKSGDDEEALVSRHRCVIDNSLLADLLQNECPLGYLVLATYDGTIKLYTLGTATDSGPDSVVVLPFTAIISKTSIQFLRHQQQQKHGQAADINGAQLPITCKRLFLSAASGKLTAAIPQLKHVTLHIGDKNPANRNSAKDVEKQSRSAFQACITTSEDVNCSASSSSGSIAFSSSSLGKPSILHIGETNLIDSSQLPQAIHIPVDTAAPVQFVTSVFKSTNTDPSSTLALLCEDGQVALASWPSQDELATWKNVPPDLPEIESRMQHLLAGLATLKLDQDAATLSLGHLDKQISALSSSIQLSSTVNTLQGLNCTVRPVAQYVYSSEHPHLLVQVLITNNSAVALPGGWSVVLATQHGTNSALNACHSASLGPLQSSSSWETNVSLPLPSSNTHTAIHMAVLLTRLQTSETNNACTLLLHSLQLDSVHMMGATSQTGVSSFSMPNTRVDNNTKNTSIKMQLAVPKRLYGLTPSSSQVLQELLHADLNSSKETEADLPPLHAGNAFAPATKEVKPSSSASVKGPLLHKGSIVPASLTVRATSSNPRRIASTKSVFEVQATASGPEVCLQIHEALLRRQSAATTKASISETSKLQVAEGVVVMPQGFADIETVVPVSENAVEVALTEVRRVKERLLQGQSIGHDDLVQSAVAMRAAIENIPLIGNE